jgi:hypothetical protein
MTQTTLNKEDSDEDNAACTEDTITSKLIQNYFQALDVVDTPTEFFKNSYISDPFSMH